MESGPAAAWRTWTTPECQFTVEYSSRVLDDIRLAVVDAFFSLPRGGAEIGGILLGAFNRNRLTISGSMPLDCEHAFGPSFKLSPRDLAKLTDELKTARISPGAKPVGWWHSHTRSELFLSDADQEIHRQFFPEPWQVALVLKPHTFQPMRGAFFFREPDGSIQGATPYLEFALDPLNVRPAPAPPPAVGARERPGFESAGPVITVEPEQGQAEGPPERDPVRPVVGAGEERGAAAPKSEIRPASPLPRTLFGVAVDPPQAAAPEPTSAGEIPPPAFLAAETPRPRRWLAPVGVVVGLGLGIAGYQTRDDWLPLVRPPAPAEPAAPVALGLRTNDNGGQLSITWDRQSSAFQGAIRSTLTIQDGAVPQVMELDQRHLQAGALTYARQTERVEVTMTIERAEGTPTREVATFLGQLPAKPAAAEDPAAVKKQRDDMAREAQRLKTEFSKQAARTKKLEQSLEEVKKQLEQRRRLENQAPGSIK